MGKIIFNIALIGVLSILNASIISQNSIAKDSTTGLVWQDEPYSEAEETAYYRDINHGKAGNWEYTKAYCENLTLGGFTDWRLPNIYELTTLLDNTKRRYPYVIDGIKNIPSTFYWFSTVDVPFTWDSYAWAVDFFDGDADWCFKTHSTFVRCVRAEELDFDDLVLLKKKSKLKVSHKVINSISPDAQGED